MANVVLTLRDLKTVVQETRKVVVKTTENRESKEEHVLRDLPNLIEPGSVHLLSFTDPAGYVAEQRVILPRLNHDLTVQSGQNARKSTSTSSTTSDQGILRQLRSEYLYKKITIALRNEPQPITGRLLGFDVDAKVLILLPEEGSGGGGDLLFLPLDDNLKHFTVHQVKDDKEDGGEVEQKEGGGKSKVAFHLSSQITGEHKLNIIYKTLGLSWKVQYTMVVNQQEDRFVFSGRYLIDNQSGKSFENATVNLISSPKEVVSETQFQQKNTFKSGFTKGAEKSITYEEPSTQDALHNVSLPDGETRQFLFVHKVFPTLKRKAFFECSPHLRLQEGQMQLNEEQGSIKVGTRTLPVIVEVDNSVANDLPRGPLTIYWMESEGELSPPEVKRQADTEFRGTLKGELLQIPQGTLLEGLSVERTRTDHRRDLKANTLTESFRVDVKNESYPRRVPVVIEDSIFRWPNWRIEKSSHDWVRNGVDLIRFNILLGLGEEQVLTYTVIYTLSPLPPTVRGKQPPSTQSQATTTTTSTPSSSTSSTPVTTTNSLAESISASAITPPLPATSQGGSQQEQPADGQKRRAFFDLFKKEDPTAAAIATTTTEATNLTTSTFLSSSPGTSSSILGIGTRSAGATDAPKVETAPAPARRGFFDLFKKNPENNPPSTAPPSSSASLSSLLPGQRSSGRSSGGSSSSMEDELLPGGDHKPDEDYQL